jgi:hypothetical protein
VRNSELEEEVTLLIKNFNALSGLLGDRAFTDDTEEDEIENQINYKFSFNNKDSKEDTIPRPLELSVKPNLQEEPLTERDLEDSEAMMIVAPQGTPASGRKKYTSTNNDE